MTYQHLGLIEEDGELWHGYVDDDDNPIEFVLDEEGDKIPSDVCLCYARGPSECMCSCTSWTEEDWEYD